MQIHSVVKALSILEAFQPDKPTMTLAELTQAVAMPRSTVQHLVDTLVQAGYLRRYAGKTYGLSWKVLELAGNLPLGFTHEQVIHRTLQQLTQCTGETSHFAVLDGHEAVFVAVYESPHSLRYVSRIGQRVKLHCTGVGKVLLAFHPELLPVVLHEGLPSLTPHTLTNPQALELELAAIRYQGYAINRQESTSDIYGVAVPVRTPQGIWAAVSVAGPPSRLAHQESSSIVECLNRAASELAPTIQVLQRGVMSATPRLDLRSTEQR